MTFYIHDFDDYAGQLVLFTADHGHEVSVDVDAAYDEDAGEWNEQVMIAAAEKAVSAAFPGSVVEYYYI